MKGYHLGWNHGGKGRGERLGENPSYFSSGEGGLTFLVGSSLGVAGALSHCIWDSFPVHRVWGYTCGQNDIHIWKQYKHYNFDESVYWDTACLIKLTVQILLQITVCTSVLFSDLGHNWLVERAAKVTHVFSDRRLPHLACCTASFQGNSE